MSEPDTAPAPDDITLQADVCIVGGGVVGLTLACELASPTCRVIVVESGGRDADADYNRRGVGRVDGAYHPLTATRERRLGGTAHLWRHGRLQVHRLDELDFDRRDVCTATGWPIAARTLTPYYERAEAALGCSLPDTDGVRRRLRDELPGAWSQALTGPLSLGLFRDEDGQQLVDRALDRLHNSRHAVVHTNATVASVTPWAAARRGCRA